MNANDLRAGMVFTLDGELQEVVAVQHVKPGKGPAYSKFKLRVVKTGKVSERSLRSNDRVEQVRITEEEGRYLYRDREDVFFLDEETMEEVLFEREAIADKLRYLREGDEVRLKKADEKIISLDLPDLVDLSVTKTVPGVKGDTVQAGRKPATLETGTVVQVPLFIKEGDVVRVDTRTGEYVTRV